MQTRDPRPAQTICHRVAALSMGAGVRMRADKNATGVFLRSYFMQA